MTDIQSQSGSGLHIATPSRRGLIDFWHGYERRYDEVQKLLLEQARSLPSLRRVLDSMTPAQLDAQSANSRHLLQRAVEANEWEPFLENLRNQGQFYAQAGVEFRLWFDLTGSFHRVVIAELVNTHVDDTPRMIEAIDAMNWYLELALGVIGESYLSMKESLIAQQQRALIELSTPVLKIREYMLLLPVIGVLDTRRARLLTDQLLQEIRSSRARAVVMDITGVAAVDSKVANHLLQTIAAARLMGAKVVVTGLSPEVAQTLVMLGVNLESVTTVGDLQGGIDLAERSLKKVIDTAEDSPSIPAVSEHHGFH